jgi:hypothetical protein
VIPARSQETTPQPTPASVEISRTIPDAKSLDDCAAQLEKTLDAYETLLKAKSDADAELITNKELRAKEETYNSELLKAVALLTSSEKRDKSFFKKLLDQLGNLLKTATNPAHLATIATLIVLIKNLK